MINKWRNARGKDSYEKKRGDIIFWILLALAGLLMLDIPFGLKPIMFEDSSAYLADRIIIGVAPGYPLFVQLNRMIFGEKFYLYIVVAEQIIINLVACLYVARLMQKEFFLKKIEVFGIFCLSLFPHTVFMPDAMSSRMIITEALAFPFFYFLIVCVYKAITKKSIAYICLSYGITVFLSLLRTQLQLTWLIPTIAVVYIIWEKVSIKKEKGWYIKVPLGVGTGVLLFIGSFFLFQQGNIWMQKLFVFCNSATVQISQEPPTISSEKVEVNDTNVKIQMSGVLYSKMMYTAKKEDVELFEDVRLQQIYRFLYQGLLNRGVILDAEKVDLTIADKIFVHLDGLYRTSFEVLTEYDQNILMEYGGAGNVLAKISMTLLKNHPIRWLQSGILQLPSGFISSVFFHFRSLYWFSHCIAFLIYALSIVLLGVSILKKWECKYIALLVIAVLTNVLFVSTTAVAYLALQRYVVYGFGFFYIAVYIGLRRIQMK